MKLTVTILVPVFKVEAYIGECARSLFGQTYRDIRYVFCDDATPDGSIDVLKATLEDFPDRRDAVTIEHHTENRGVGATRLTLIGKVDTEAFLFVDSDDSLPCDAVEKLVKRMSETGTDVVDGAYVEVGGPADGRRHLSFHGNETEYRNRILCQTFQTSYVWGKLYRTEVLSRIDDLFFPGIDMAEDFCATGRLVDFCSRSWVDDVTYRYRRDSAGSITNNISEKELLSYCSACDKVLSYYRKQEKNSRFLETGVLNAYRKARVYGVGFDKVNTRLDYTPAYLFSTLLKRMFVSSSTPFFLSDFLYRVIRRLILMTA